MHTQQVALVVVCVMPGGGTGWGWHGLRRRFLSPVLVGRSGGEAEAFAAQIGAKA